MTLTPRRLLAIALAVAAGLAAPAGALAAPSVTVYFTRGEHFSPVRRTLPPGQSAATFAVRQLLAGPTTLERAVGVRTLIPAGTTLRSITTTSGRAQVVLSQRFTADASTDTLTGRLTQVVRTVGDLPGIRSVQVLSADATGAVIPSGGEFDPGDLTPAGSGLPEPATPGSSLTPGRYTTRDLQRRLVALGYLPASAVNGDDDYRTQQAVMAFQAWQGIGRDGVVGPQTRRALDSAQPPRPQVASQGPRIEVYRDKGVALLISGGKVVRAVHVSTGRAGYSTPSGTYDVYRKSIKDWSYPFQVWLPYASYFTGGIAFHEYPDVPAYPASHGCVRVSAPEAPFVYQFAKIGTPVAVY